MKRPENISKERWERMQQETAMALYSMARNIVKYRGYNCTVSEFMEHPERYEK